MTKQEASRILRKRLTAAIRSLPDDVDYKCVSLFEDSTTQGERDHETRMCGNDCGNEGKLHIIELIVEETRKENGRAK